MTTLPERLQWILDQRGWSQRELARRAGLKSETHVGLLMKEKTRPNAETMLRIAAAAKVRLEWLVSGEEPIERPVSRRAIISNLIHPVVERVGRTLGHWLLRRHGYDGADEAAADYLGAALIAPRAAFVRAHRVHGDGLDKLADAFGTTETGAALRLGEVLRRPLAVVAPKTVRVRGPEEWTWPDEATLRRWARNPRPGLRKAKLGDDPRRVVLEVDER